MKQVLQNMRSGVTEVVETPVPGVRSRAALIHTAVSLVSAGTERNVVEFAEKSLVGKARSRPDLVRQVLDKARREGLVTTIETAFNRLDQPTALGYSSAGTIVEIGPGLEGFKVGDRVACAGGGFAVHAEYAVVPQNLLIPLPDEVDFESAAFTTLGGIALQGFRLARPQIGDRVAVIGLGLLGLLTAQIAKAAGCQVFGLDLSPARVALARQFGITAVPRADAETAGRAFTSGRGFDAVLICADSRSNDPTELAGALCRDRGQVISIGVVGLNLPRKVYYEKEIHFQVSRSYGPGRYDPAYEERGVDYPYGYVRWTEGRNLSAFVELLASGQVDVKPLITHRFAIDSAADAYALITGKAQQPYMGVLLAYPQDQAQPASRRVELRPATPALAGAPRLGVLGAGNYASAVFLPNVQAVGGAERIGIASASGMSARTAAQRYGFRYASSSEQQVLEDPEVNLLAILTRHNQHARQVMAGLRLGKPVFCEKPLAINNDELAEIAAELAKPGCPLLMVGFNRRFAPFAVKLKSFLSGTGEPLAMHYRINASALPLSHWQHDPIVGGGRIIGEGCHFIDFLTYLVGSAPQSVYAVALPDRGQYRQDNVTATFTFADGSIGTVSYLANGDKSFPKERVEVFSGGRVAALDDFRTLELVKDGRRSTERSTLRQDKGHRAAWQAFLSSAQGGQPPIAYTDLLSVTQASFAVMESLRTGQSVRIETPQVADEEN